MADPIIQLSAVQVAGQFDQAIELDWDEEDLVTEPPLMAVALMLPLVETEAHVIEEEATPTRFMIEPLEVRPHTRRVAG